MGRGAGSAGQVLAPKYLETWTRTYRDPRFDDRRQEISSERLKSLAPRRLTTRTRPAKASPAVTWGSDMAVPEATDRAEPASTIARLLASDMREELLAIMRKISGRTAFAERLAYSPDEAAELLGISRELVHDLLRTGQLGSVKAGRRRLIGKHHLEAFLADES